MSLNRARLITVAVLVGCGGQATPPPVFKNAPLRVLPGRATPAQRESTLRIGSCAPAQKFSVAVDDPDATDTVRSLWFIDPDERYVGGVSGNPVAGVTGESTVREVQATPAFRAQFAALTDGRKHRVEVVVTDGEFVEDEAVDPITMERKTVLKTVRPSLTLSDGGSQAIDAFRDEYMWLVEVTPCP